MVGKTVIATNTRFNGKIVVSEEAMIGPMAFPKSNDIRYIVFAINLLSCGEFFEMKSAVIG
jgi:hypothetical protein